MKTDLPKWSEFKRADIRRGLVVLLAIEAMKERATTYYIAQELDTNRSDIIRAIKNLESQYLVKFEKDKSTYSIRSWGLLNREAVIEELQSFSAVED